MYKKQNKKVKQQKAPSITTPKNKTTKRQKITITTTKQTKKMKNKQKLKLTK